MCVRVCGSVGCSATGSTTLRHALRMCNAASVLIIRHVCTVKPNNEPAPAKAELSKKRLQRQPRPTSSNTMSNGPLIMQRLPKAILIREPQSICHLWMVKIARHSFHMRFVSPSTPHAPLSCRSLAIHYANFSAYHLLPVKGSREVGRT